MARKILLADDSVTAQNMGRKILTDAGYEVVTVNNGSAALKKIIEHKPDLIVLDVYMPGYSGLEVCQRIKENRDTARIPVLLTVGKLEPFKPEEARRARADAFVVKPFEASELLAALTKLEDKVIPQPEPYKPGRFAKAVASFDRETEAAKYTDPDESWKARLRIPTGPPKSRDTEPDPDYAGTQGKGFRDFVEPGAKKPEPKPTEAKAERPLPAGVPHDITPEEIAAITAAAARLSGAAPAPSAPADQHAIETQPVEATSEGSVAEIESAPPEENAPVTFASSPEISSAEPDAVSSQIPTEEASGAPEIVEAAAASERIEEETLTQSEAISNDMQGGAIEAIAPEVESQAVTVTEPSIAEPKADEIAAVSSAEPEDIPKSSEPSLPPAADLPASEIPANVAPPPIAEAGDEEVLAALQTLMPSASACEQPANGRPKDEGYSAAAMASGTAARAHEAGPRWIAEEVALAADEATIALEREMQKAYAVVATETDVRAATASTDAMTASEMSSGASSTALESAGAMYAVASASAGEAIAAQLPQPMHAPIEDESAMGQESSAAQDSITSPGTGTPEMPEAMIEMTDASAKAATIAGTSIENEIVGGIEDMAANWKNIRDSIAGAAAKPAPAKEDFHEPVPAPAEPEAAAPMAASEKSSLAATDPKAIASIVESVLAELRPKLVEEIAKKIADSKKE